MAQHANDSWSMDFVSDQLVGGQRFRLLSLSITIAVRAWRSKVGQRLTGDDVVRVLEGVASQRGKPQTIRVDNGPEFISRSLDLWAYFNGVKLDFSRPGKPTDNAFIESFNGRLRVECLNQHWFLSLDEARAVTEALEGRLLFAFVRMVLWATRRGSNSRGHGGAALEEATAVSWA